MLNAWPIASRQTTTHALVRSASREMEPAAMVSDLTRTDLSFILRIFAKECLKILKMLTNARLASRIATSMPSAITWSVTMNADVDHHTKEMEKSVIMI